MLALALTLMVATTGSPRIELITIGPGSHFTTYWGHTALRVFDPSDGSDLAYNFGGIDTEGDFVLRMMRGHVEAFVFQSSFSELLKQYSGEDRTITRRPLRLSEEAATALAARLAEATTSSRARYRYDHFRDNCSTRVAEELDRALGGTLRARGEGRATGTFRSRVLVPARRDTALYLALDLASSGVIDRPIRRWETAFLCEDLATLVDAVKVEDEHLVSGEFEIFRSISQAPDVLWTWPWVKVYVLFVAPLFILGLFFARPVALLFGLTAGLAGSALLVVGLVSTYDFLQHNWNVLILPPTHLALALAATRARWFTAWREKLFAYLALHGAVLLALLAASQAGLIAQAIGPALGFSLPLTLVLGRSCLPVGRSEA